MSKLEIAIIDGGVDTEHPLFKGNVPHVISYCSEKGNAEGVGHGTAIYNIIRKTADFANITNFCVMDKEGNIDEAMFLACLRDIRDDNRFDIVNMSLGLEISDNIEEIERICNDIVYNGCILISAFDNYNSISYPAAFSSVIGVTSSELCRKTNDFIVYNDDVLNIAANGNLQRLAWSNPNYLMLNGNSFACAHVAVRAAEFLSMRKMTKEELLEQFSKEALFTEEIMNREEKKANSFVNTIHRAAIFPFNKEMHSLIRFNRLLSFSIVGVYDIKESARVGATASQVMKMDVDYFKIENIEMIDWDKIDTIILGNIPETSVPMLKRKRNTLVEEAISRDKLVFSFDDIYNSMSEVYHNQVVCPSVGKNDIPPERLGKLFRISKPVLGIYGTSSSQGKFTLQLMLREKFLKNGYKVGQIGTEPSSFLFGFEYCFPIGYNCSVTLSPHETIRYLNNCINNLCREECDIIITGSQAGVIPYDTGNTGMFPLRQFHFLMATQPDCVVLCVNPYDDCEYVSRSIGFLEMSVNCKVIAICVYPVDIKDDWTALYGQKVHMCDEKMRVLKDILHKRFSIPAYSLDSEDDIFELYSSITDYFTEA